MNSLSSAISIRILLKARSSIFVWLVAHALDRHGFSSLWPGVGNVHANRRTRLRCSQICCGRIRCRQRIDQRPQVEEILGRKRRTERSMVARKNDSEKMKSPLYPALNCRLSFAASRTAGDSATQNPSRPILTAGGHSSKAPTERWESTSFILFILFSKEPFVPRGTRSAWYPKNSLVEAVPHLVVARYNGRRITMDHHPCATASHLSQSQETSDLLDFRSVT